MMTRNRRRSGRGYTRDDWINHHKNIVERSAKGSKLDPQETERFTMESLIEHSIFTEQDREVVVDRQQYKETKHTGEIETSETRKVVKFGKVQAENGSKSIEIEGKEKKNDSINREEPVNTGTTSTRGISKVRTPENHTTKQGTEKNNDTLQNMDINNDDSFDKNTQRKGSFSTTSVVEVDSDMCLEEISDDENSRCQQEEAVKQMARKRNSQQNTEVTIKQEAIEEALTEHTMYQEAETGSSGEESVCSMSESDSSTSIFSSSSDESDERSTLDTGKDKEGMFSKRKSEYVAETKKQKRQHVTKGPEKLSNGQRKLPIEWVKNSNPQSTTDTTNDPNESDSEDELSDTQDKQPMNRTNDLDRGTVVQKFTSEPVQSENSDTEWKNIAYENKKIHQSLATRVRKQNEMPYKPAPVKKVQISNQVTIVTENKYRPSPDIKTRGINLTDQKEMISTPIKIEFNVENTSTEFYVLQEFSELLGTMAAQDPSIRLRDKVNGTVVWEAGSQLPENEQFTELFKMREQSYRKGNKKITLFCVVEATYTINRIKYSEPTRTHIFQRNIWLKPDFYSTQIVSCPGFMTLVHPKITNKRQLVESLTEIIRSTGINQEEDTVKSWKKRQESQGNNSDMIPRFHLETNTRKWRDIQTEVLSIHCSTEDATYLKYLLSEASSQGKIDQGIFVPTGIHLMEGKEVMYQLLKEQKEFVDNVTSFQLGGIMQDEMYAAENNQESIKRILMKAGGVWAVEQTYQTNYNGQWLVVVDKNKVNQLTEHIKQNIQTIYKNRKAGTTPKLVTYQIDRDIYGYKLLLVENNIGKVGTYAEALKRRFPHLTKPEQTDQQRYGIPVSKTPSTDANHLVNERRKAEGSNERNRLQSRASRINVGDNFTDTRTNGGQYNPSLMQSTVCTPDEERHENTYANDGNQSTRINTETKQTDLTDIFQKKMDAFDQEWQSKLQEFEEMNSQLMKQVNKKIEDRIDKIMDTKTKEISTEVSNTVTFQLVLAMKKIFPGHKFPADVTEKKQLDTGKDSGLTRKIEKQITVGQNIGLINNTENLTSTKSTEKSTEPSNEEKQLIIPTDSNHDKLITESSRLER